MPFDSARYVYRHGLKRIAAAFFDFVGAWLTLPFRHPPANIESVKKILVIRLDQIGDVVMTRPALKAIQERFPQAEMDALVSSETAPLFSFIPGIHTVIVFKGGWFSILRLLRLRKYDLAIDFRGDLRNIALMAAAGIPHRLGYGITGGGFLLTHEGRFSRRLHQVELNLQLLSPLKVESRLDRSNRFEYSSSQ